MLLIEAIYPLGRGSNLIRLISSSSSSSSSIRVRFAGATFSPLAMWGSSRESQLSGKLKREKAGGLSEGFQLENFVPGLVIGFILGLFIDLSTKPSRGSSSAIKKNFLPGKPQQQNPDSPSGDSNRELKMVLVVRQDLKMGAGKIASQCAHASTGLYSELIHSDSLLLRQWEQCGQPKIVVTCKNQTEMNKLKEAAENIGLPTFVVADAGRTQVAAGSKTVMAVGPGPKSSVDSVTGKLRLL